MTNITILIIMMALIIRCGNETYFYLMDNNTAVALFFSILTFIASVGIILFLHAVRMSNRNAIKQGFYLIMFSFLCGLIMMGWAITTF